MKKYDEQMQRLTEDPDRIYKDWEHSEGLFDFLNSHYLPAPPIGCVGCLTMIKQGPWVAITPELTERIRNDPRVPERVSDITVDNLSVFQEYQEEADRTIRDPEWCIRYRSENPPQEK